MRRAIPCTREEHCIRPSPWGFFLFLFFFIQHAIHQFSFRRIFFLLVCATAAVSPATRARRVRVASRVLCAEKTGHSGTLHPNYTWVAATTKSCWPAAIFAPRRQGQRPLSPSSPGSRCAGCHRAREQDRRGHRRASESVAAAGVRVPIYAGRSRRDTLLPALLGRSPPAIFSAHAAARSAPSVRAQARRVAAPPWTKRGLSFSPFSRVRTSCATMLRTGNQPLPWHAGEAAFRRERAGTPSFVHASAAVRRAAPASVFLARVDASLP
jgi:hypothetical protein